MGAGGVMALALAASLWMGTGRLGATEASSTGAVREPILAGTWYPGSPATLKRQVEEFLDQAKTPPIKGRLVALIAPHAGYVYSGQVAAHAYKSLGGQKFQTVVILAPSHQARFTGAALWEGDGFRTPLGLVPLDRGLMADIHKSNPQIRYLPEAHAREHAIEIQLPFLQTVMPGFSLVPMVLGDQDWASCQTVANAIADSIQGKSVLVLASSDLSHYHPYGKAGQLDQIVLDRVNAFDAQGLSRSLERGECEACGGGPIVTAMLIARRLGADSARVLYHANSGDVSGDRDRVVGYMAAALWADGEGQSSHTASGDRKVGVDLGLSPDEKAFLHRMVKEIIEEKCRGGKPRQVGAAGSRLQEHRGAFVTLYKNGSLRGCIGQIVSDRPLVDTLSEMAVAAAFHDPRFPPVGENELKDLKIEISILTPLQRIDKAEDIQVGKHGIFMKQGGYSGLLLPQVATEYGWDRAAFLENTCTKARLPKDAWKDKSTEIYIFSADVF